MQTRVLASNRLQCIVNLILLASTACGFVHAHNIICCKHLLCMEQMLSNRHACRWWQSRSSASLTRYMVVGAPSDQLHRCRSESC